MLTIDKEFFSPPQIATLLGVDPWKVHEFIRRGELRAVDISTNRAVKPRYRISRADFESFLLRRSTSPPPPPQRKRKQDDGEIDFFP